MYAVSLAGSDAESALGRLSDAIDGRVGVVRTDAVESDGGQVLTRGTTTYVVDNGWRASGDDCSVRDAIDRLAPDHEYAFVLGTPAVRLPRIVVGDCEANRDDESDEPLVSVADVTELDVDETIGLIHGTEPYETLESLVAAVKRSDRATYSGAIATFTGRVRAKEDDADERTHYLEFEKYEGVAERRMADIESDLEEREGVLDVRLHHRTGNIPDGEDIVFVVVLAGHREEAFEAVRDGINRLKDEVPLFKKEVTVDDEFWVHEQS